MRVHIADTHHRHTMFEKLSEDHDYQLHWTKENIELFFTVGADGTHVSSVKVMNNCKLRNTAYSKALPCGDSLDLLRVVISYVRTYYYCCEVLFRDVRLYEERRDMESANFILIEAHVYNLHIRLACLCIMNPSLLDLITGLNNPYPVRPNNSTT